LLFSSFHRHFHHILSDVVDANMKTHPLTGDDRALIRTLRVEKG